ncbi:stage II sporulation protein R [Clostridium lundense]|uniref:stage II sporulation protein R n=1 Tax=Clostridium lundense TaxID=319475 RepID=UPI00047F1848|nr:stage II sporulation protein R [Clostridium lundense]
MKKLMTIITIIFIIVSISLGLPKVKTSIQQKHIANKLIRFHVIANSDMVYDQKLKLEVKDSILQYISPKLQKSKSIDESRKIIKNNDRAIKEIANKIIKKNGYDYSVNTTLSYENFPVKTYGNVSLPQGKYEAYRIIIGKGEGQNWWCVMFPPLCFIDITKGQIAYNETEKEMKSVLTENEYKAIDNRIENDKVNYNKDKKIKMKFKILEIAENIFK